MKKHIFIRFKNMDYVYIYLIITILLLTVGVALITSAHHDKTATIQTSIWLGWFSVLVITLTGVIYWSKTTLIKQRLTHNAKNAFMLLCILVTLMSIAVGVLAILWNTGGDCKGSVITGETSRPFWGAIIVFIGSIGPILIAFELDYQARLVQKSIVVSRPVLTEEFNPTFYKKLQVIANSQYNRKEFPERVVRAQKLMIRYKNNPTQYRDEVKAFTETMCLVSDVECPTDYDQNLLDKLYLARDIVTKRKLVGPERVTEIIEKYKENPTVFESSARNISNVICGIPGESCDAVNPNVSPDLLKRLQQIRDSIGSDQVQTDKIDRVIQLYEFEPRKYYELAKFTADDYCKSSEGLFGCTRWSS